MGEICIQVDKHTHTHTRTMRLTTRMSSFHKLCQPAPPQQSVCPLKRATDDYKFLEELTTCKSRVKVVEERCTSAALLLWMSQVSVLLYFSHLLGVHE